MKSLFRNCYFVFIVLKHSYCYSGGFVVAYGVWSKYSRGNNRWIFFILFGFFCRFYYSNSNSDSVLSIRKVTGCQLFFRPQASDSGFVHSVTQTIHDWFVIDALLLLRHEVINFFNLSSTN